MTGFVKWLTAAVLAGLAGAFAWAAITYFTGYEIGWIAWGVGFVVGAAVRASAGSDTGFGPGSVAVVGAIGALLLGKYAAVHFLVQKELGAMQMPAMSTENMLVSLSDEIVEERMAAGEEVKFPEGQTLETAGSEADYPPEIWAEASRRWNELPPDEQKRQLDEHQQVMQQFSGMMQEMATVEGFKESFSPIDLLFFGLAVLTAWRLGAGGETQAA